VPFYSALINKNTELDPADTFEAADFDEAADIVRAKYPEQAFRLYLGKGIPEKKVNQAIPPKLPKKE
jgi:hypothetical protein